jgi:hypothetical protein
MRHYLAYPNKRLDRVSTSVLLHTFQKIIFLLEHLWVFARDIRKLGIDLGKREIIILKQTTKPKERLVTIGFHRHQFELRLLQRRLLVLGQLSLFGRSQEPSGPLVLVS